MSLALICSAPAVELNPEQMLAVEHGIGEAAGPGPLLVIAGAGSGKTAMLAHRVAALILAGADPKRIMLATFSRRAAAELGRRVERLLARASCARSRGGGFARLFGHVSCDRRAAPARICPAPWPRPAIHHPRPRGFGGPDELGAARGRPHRDEGALSHQGDMPRHLFARRQRARRPRPDDRQMVSLGRGA